MSKIFIHIIVTLIQVLQRQTTSIFFQLIHHQKTSKSVAALMTLTYRLIWDQVHLLWKKKK